jgi:hypothetical protein
MDSFGVAKIHPSKAPRCGCLDSSDPGNARDGQSGFQSMPCAITQILGGKSSAKDQL